MNSIIEKIGEYINHKKIPVSKAESMIGVSNGTLSKPLKNKKTIKTDTLEKFLRHFTDINPLWLTLGEGEMILDRNHTTVKERSRAIAFNVMQESLNEPDSSYQIAIMLREALIKTFCDEFPKVSEGYLLSSSFRFGIAGKAIQSLVSYKRSEFIDLGIENRAIYYIEEKDIKDENVLYEELKIEYYPKIKELMSDTFYRDLKKLNTEINQFSNKYKDYLTTKQEMSLEIKKRLRNMKIK